MTNNTARPQRNGQRCQELLIASSRLTSMAVQVQSIGELLSSSAVSRDEEWTMRAGIGGILENLGKKMLNVLEDVPVSEQELQWLLDELHDSQERPQDE